MNRRTLRTRLAALARLTARGVVQGEIAKEMKIAPTTIRKWQSQHGKLLDVLIEKEKRVIFETTQKETAILESVRAAAGTEAVYDDPDRYLLLAQQAAKIADKRGETLFEANGEETLSQFFERYFVPLSEAKEESLSQYRIILRQWAYFSGDPPLVNITSPMLAEFKKFVSNMHGVKSFRKARPETIRKKLRHIQTVLYKAGPPGPHNRDAAGIIERVPYVRPPRPQLSPPKIVSEDKFNNCYLAACGMEKPRFAGIKPAAWWRALLVVAFNTGLRRRTLFELRMDDIDWQNHCLIIPAARMKAGRPHVVHLNETVLDHLLKIRTDRELVFPQDVRTLQVFHKRFHKLQDLAGISRDEHFGLHAIRKTTATRLWEIAPQAAQLALGHAASDVTIKHYVHSTGIVSRALDALPQPEAFVG